MRRRGESGSGYSSKAASSGDSSKAASLGRLLEGQRFLGRLLDGREPRATPRRPRARATPRRPRPRATPRRPRPRATARRPRPRATPRRPRPARATTSRRPASPGRLLDGRELGRLLEGREPRATPRRPRAWATPRRPRARATPRRPRARATTPRRPRGFPGDYSKAASSGDSSKAASSGDSLDGRVFGLLLEGRELGLLLEGRELGRLLEGRELGLLLEGRELGRPLDGREPSGDSSTAASSGRVRRCGIDRQERARQGRRERPRDRDLLGRGGEAIPGGALGTSGRAASLGRHLSTAPRPARTDRGCRRDADAAARRPGGLAVLGLLLPTPQEPARGGDARPRYSRRLPFWPPLSHGSAFRATMRRKPDSMHGRASAASVAETTCAPMPPASPSSSPMSPATTCAVPSSSRRWRCCSPTQLAPWARSMGGATPGGGALQHPRLPTCDGGGRMGAWQVHLDRAVDRLVERRGRRRELARRCVGGVGAGTASTPRPGTTHLKAVEKATAWSAGHPWRSAP